MNASILIVTREATETAGYVVGAIIALFIMGYLIYSLVKPERF
ncbi:K(+)-transporting ATPase subunit F [bacterium]|nr:K(+)-transporting ATPase subunit F [bacterium]